MFLPNERITSTIYADYHTANIDKAKQIMEAAGWKLGSDGIYALADGTKAAVPDQSQGHRTRQKAVQLIQGYCKKAGIDGRDDQDAKFNADAAARKSDFDAALFAWVGTPFKSGGYRQLHHRRRDNYNKLSDPTVDKLFKQSQHRARCRPSALKINQDLNKAIMDTYSTFPTYQFADMVAQINAITPALTYVGPFGGALWNANQWVYKQ